MRTFSPTFRLRTFLWAVALMAAGFGALALSSSGSSGLYYNPTPNPISSIPRPFPLVISPDPIALGAVHQRQPVQTSVLVRNLRSVPLILEQIETSCPCVEMGEVPLRFQPNEAKSLRVTFDPSHDPEFEGQLSVQVSAYLSDGRLGFRTNVNLKSHPERGEHRH